jgi:ferredoxin-NADP reductase
MRPWRSPGLSREEARAHLRPGNFQGTPPKGRSHEAEEAAIERLEGHWSATGRYRRRARVTRVEPLTSTGTVRLGFEVVDGEPFDYAPGQFVGIELHFEGQGYRRSPYCIVSPPDGEPRFDLLVRVVPQGPLSVGLAKLVPGDEVAFRGPTGRSMVPRHDDRELHLLATGTGVAPFVSLAHRLFDGGYPQPVVLWWGLRLGEDICLTDELDSLADRHPGFSYHITLSQPPPGWTGLRGRLGDSVPPRWETLGGKHFCLAGNGAMLQEMSLALSDLGVSQKYIYTEPYFDPAHQPDPKVVAAIRERFVATDLFSAYAARRGSAFDLDRDLDAAVSGRAGNGDPLAVSDLFDLLPAFLSHHPDQENPAPTHVERPWNRTY